MHSGFAPGAFSYGLSALLMSTAAFATTPVVTVAVPLTAPQPPAPFAMSLRPSSPDCASGISALEIYSAPGKSAAATGGGTMNTFINLPKGTYNTVVQAFDNLEG